MALQKAKKSVPAKIKKIQKTSVSNGASTTSEKKGEYTVAIGRRKTAVARVRLFHGGNTITVNGKPAKDYFRPVDSLDVLVYQALKATNTLGTVSFTIKVAGSGLRAQLDACIHGIARALLKMDPEHRAVLRKAGLLTRDDRMRESRKIGLGGRARKQKQSPKR